MLGVSVLGSLPAGAAAAAAAAAPAATTTTQPHLPAVTTLGQELLVPGGAPKLPAACNRSWTTKAWPPHVDAGVTTHALRASDLPAGLHEHPPSFATNTPNLNELAVGWPHAAFTEVFFSEGSGTGPGSTVDEIVGRAASADAATSSYRADRDELFGSCQQYYPGPPLPRYALAHNVPDLFAYETVDDTRGFSTAVVTVVGHRGRFVFDLSVGTYGYSTEVSAPTVAAPAPPQVNTVLDAALARLGGH
jgi:hypothetical protein